MKVTDKMVERMCRALASEDWLPDNWEAEFDDQVCPQCGHALNADGDGGESVRYQVRAFLEKALGSDG